ncbi:MULTISPECIES: DoxX family protein [unclassified Cupriavidus]|jgi:putative oxidoreductase|uniref:DoxX family protein n=1 Tax=unclassified Cupriavidus TaxID=2640874 RepID=UPI001C003EFE|nr:MULTISPECIES: DoxX family protein [unclassified Cupriavidus]MCA3185700.1 DoxX family protein [Cupriavidus sp.]MCA3189643.1 DoxX family protein [Cupriavidus sp.]MCA3195719.1 DoxX family protein [Cupriavidus sp.]MCA3203876.1 DoxX family protein [Cupriavidus sp.]MCA3206163.1 DoxX family protein [Cupriavidus sp.]
MSRTQGTQDLGKAILRIVLGVLILLHGISKLMAGPGFVMQVVAQAGLPAALAYGVYIGEVVAPILLIIGLWTRLAALIVAINMLFAFALVHAKQLGEMAPTGGWALELQAMYLAAALAVALLGAGRMSVGGIDGKWN